MTKPFQHPKKNIGEIPEKKFIISNFSKEILLDRYWNEKVHSILKELLIIIEDLLSKILFDKYKIDFQQHYPQDLRTFSNQNNMKLIFDLLVKLIPHIKIYVKNKRASWSKFYPSK